MDASKLKLPASIVAGIVAATLAGGGAWAVAADRLESSRARIERLEVRQDLSAREAESQRMKTQRLEDALVGVADMLKEVRQDVREIKRR